MISESIPMIVTATEFTLGSWFKYLEFFADTYRVVKQARVSGGLVFLKINPVSLRTITAWKTLEDMQAFRNSGAHLLAMKKSRAFGDIQSVTWESDSLPTWKEAISRLAADK